MLNPKLECVKHIYNRPTESQALGAVIQDYIKHCEGEIKVEQIVAQVRIMISDAAKKGIVL
jgi:hypothetical protein